MTGEPKAGMFISPHLQLVRPLGSGAMASVWVARHRTLGIEFAVKFVAPELAADDAYDVAERFDREAKAIARIKCPHVVQIFDYGQLDNGDPDGPETPYIVMELLEGQDLAELITREGPLSMAEVSQLITQVATALDSAHALGIIHRDLKPGNICVTGAGEERFYKVLDFGIAKHEETNGEERITITKTGHAMGTPGFMSPEQWVNAKGVDHRTDIWALGAVAYCALTDRVPFDAESPAKAMFATCAGELTPASMANAALPYELDAWFEKAMCPHPEDRFDSAGDMARAFAEIVADSGRLSFSDRPTTIRPMPTESDRSGEHDPPSFPPMAMSTLPPGVSSPVDNANRRAWRQRARIVTRAVIGGLVMTAAVASVGAATSHELESRAASFGSPMFAPADLATSVHTTAVVAPAQEEEAHAEVGYLTILCTPACDGAWEAGHSLGAPPITKRSMATGAHTITVKRNGEGTATFSVTIDNDSHTFLRVPRLRKAPAPAAAPPSRDDAASP